MNSPVSNAQLQPAPNELVTFDTHPDRYHHWKLSVDGNIATLALDINEERGIRPGYRMKLNSYDLGVDIELHDALQRIRFEHPQVATVIVTSAKDRIFCSGANIYMLGISSHAWKVNFCKFTNETRNGIEDSSQFSGIKFLAAVNGACAGGGYELALACDEILLIDDRSSSVSLPEVALLGVLPGTGGLTRLTDKRKVRRDHADIFCTVSEGLRAEKALAWRLIDGHAKPQQFSEVVKQRAEKLAKNSARPANAQGIELTPLKRLIDATGYHYETVDVVFDREQRKATITVSAPYGTEPDNVDAIVAAGANWWPLKMARELDDAILLLRSNELTLGTWEIKTRGGSSSILACDQALEGFSEHWLVKETIGMIRRTFARLEVSSRTLFAIVDQPSCFAGTLLELALAADRAYMLHLPSDAADAPHLQLSAMNFGPYPNVQNETRLATRFYAEAEPLAAIKSALGNPIGAEQALALGLVTITPDDLDWDDEIRLAFEERASLSPDALTGMEANLRFNGETMATRIFGRLSAWQNWIFNRPNAVGEHGALKIFGSGKKAQFNRDRI
jgi:benzoyl-CoA-dihydrodiol lyase